MPSHISAHLNIILGDSAAGTFKGTFGNSIGLVVDPDVLSCGPTPRRDDLGAWKAMRLNFWQVLVPTVFDDREARPWDLLENIAELRDAKRITAWAATGVSEQLFLASVCNLLATCDVPLDRVELVQFEDLAGASRTRVIAMGVLNEEQMRNHPTAVPLSRDVLEHYLRAWDALTSPDPRDVELFAAKHPSANPWLKDAMRLMLRRFPERNTGLSHWDFRSLGNVHDHGPTAARVIGHTMTENWDDADPVGDWYLFGRLLRMGAESLPKPLLKFAGDLRDMRQTTVELTDFGRDVLEGRASNYPSNPIDDWAGGVRLSSSEQRLWFRDGDRLVAAS
jgi:hypothetical protein